MSVETWNAASIDSATIDTNTLEPVVSERHLSSDSKSGSVAEETIIRDDPTSLVNAR